MTMGDEQRTIGVNLELNDNASAAIATAQRQLDQYTEALNRLYAAQARVGGGGVPGPATVGAGPGVASGASGGVTAVGAGIVGAPANGAAGLVGTHAVLRNIQGTVQNINRTPINPPIPAGALRNLQQVQSSMAGIALGLGAVKSLVAGGALVTMAAQVAGLANAFQRTAIGYGTTFGNQGAGAAYAGQVQGQLAGSGFNLNDTSKLQQNLVGLSQMAYGTTGGAAYATGMASQIQSLSQTLAGAYNVPLSGVSAPFVGALSTPLARFTKADADALYAQRIPIYDLLAQGERARHPGSNITGQQIMLLMARSPAGVPVNQIVEDLNAARSANAQLRAGAQAYQQSPGAQQQDFLNMLGIAGQNAGNAVNTLIGPFAAFGAQGPVQAGLVAGAGLVGGGFALTKLGGRALGWAGRAFGSGVQTATGAATQATSAAAKVADPIAARYADILKQASQDFPPDIAERIAKQQIEKEFPGGAAPTAGTGPRGPVGGMPLAGGVPSLSTLRQIENQVYPGWDTREQAAWAPVNAAVGSAFNDTLKQATRSVSDFATMMENAKRAIGGGPAAIGGIIGALWDEARKHLPGGGGGGGSSTSGGGDIGAGVVGGGPDSSSHAAFVQSLLPTAQKYSALTGIPVDVLLAINASEGGWGGAGNELFGMKALPGQPSVALKTWEAGPNGERIPTTASFAAYNSPDEAYAAFAGLLQSPRYAGVYAQFQKDHDVNGLLRGLTAQGYATDKNWAAAIGGIASGQIDPLLGSGGTSSGTGMQTTAYHGGGASVGTMIINLNFATVPSDPQSVKAMANMLMTEMYRQLSQADANDGSTPQPLEGPLVSV